MVQAHVGPVCHALQHPTAAVCVPRPGRSSVGGGCLLPLLDGVRSVCLPSLRPPSSRAQEGGGGLSQNDPRGSLVARSAMVPRPNSTCSGRSSTSRPGSQGARSAPVLNSSRESRRSVSERVALVHGSLRRSGASPEALSLLLVAHRVSTRSVYAAHWRRWAQWCFRHRVDPCAPSEVDIANHLAFLSSSLSLSPSSLRVRRSAIRTTLSQLGFSPMGSSRVVADVIRGAALRYARAPRRVPSWDLFLVLAYLRGPPFEPLVSASLAALTMKAVFLITLASGRRCSEVHALSGLDSDVSYEADGSVSLRFLPEFLAKNQRPGDPSPLVRIRPLSHLVHRSEPDALNCPVRALRLYLSRCPRSPAKRRLSL